MISTSSSSHTSDASLAAAIGDAGRRASRRSLWLILLGGSVGLVAILLLWHRHRMLAVPLVMPVTFGVWGLAVHAEQRLAADVFDTRVERALLRGLRGAMIVLGTAAAIVTLFGITFAFSGSGGLQMR